MAEKETIGNGKCSCVFPFEKHYLKLGIDKLIDIEDKEIKHIQEGAEVIRKSGITSPEALTEIHENLKRDLETTKRRLENTPPC